MLLMVKKVAGAINKLHVLTHKELCQIIYNLNWLLYIGMILVEMIKMGWAEHNLTAGSTWEMNKGHRHDVIDGMSDHWNWEKTIKLCKYQVLQGGGPATDLDPSRSSDLAIPGGKVRAASSHNLFQCPRHVPPKLLQGCPLEMGSPG